ncbi:MAG: 3',5'-cyclic-nucleotide phosphodiesterase [Rubrivivax sp.]|nr:3',5'-cyclic-nucleotide phosphodiesterase [Rubrivivax sp.]
MPVRVLGCSGSIAANCRTTAFLVGKEILVDAGTGVGDLSLEELVAIDHVLISHSHLDHIAAIPLLADSVMRHRAARRRPAIQIHALSQTLQALRQHIFNDVIWPDFTVLPSADKPVLELHPFELGQRLHLAAHTIEVLPASHTVPAVGFAVWRDEALDDGCWVFTGDTGPNPALWERLKTMHVSQLVIETAFSDDDRHVAERSGHLHPAALGRELRQLQTPVDVFITHIKPGENEPVMQSVMRLVQPHRVRALQTGERLWFSGEQPD